MTLVADRATVEAIFTAKGELGISFAASDPSACPSIKAIAADGLAAQLPQLRAGLVLHTVQGQAVVGLPFNDCLALIGAASRPTTLTFLEPGSENGDRASAADGRSTAAADAGDVSVTFRKQGSLGLKFAPITGKQGLQLVRVNPGTQAEDHPELQRAGDAPPLLLTEILRDDGESLRSSIEALSYDEGRQALKKSGRPVTLHFIPQLSGADKLRAARAARLDPVATAPGRPTVGPPQAAAEVERDSASSIEALSPEVKGTDDQLPAPTTRKSRRDSKGKKGQSASSNGSSRQSSRGSSGDRPVRRGSLGTIVPVVEMAGPLYKSSSKDPATSKGKWKEFYFVLTSGRVSSMKWYKSEDDFNKSKEPKGQWLVVSCEAMFVSAPLPQSNTARFFRFDFPLEHH